MIKKWQSVYPSSNLPQEAIQEYGWEFLEDIPAQLNNAGSLSPVAEASQYFRDLRKHIDDRPTIVLGTEHGPVEIEDFAVAHSPNDTVSSLGFFVLRPRIMTESK